MAKSKRSIIFFVILLFILVFLGLFIYHNFINVRTKLKNQLISGELVPATRKGIGILIDNLTDKQCNKIYKNFSGKKVLLFRLQHPELAKNINHFALQDVIDKNILNVVEKIKDTMCVDVNYKEQLKEMTISIDWDYSKHIFKNIKKVIAQFLGPENYDFSSVDLTFSSKNYDCSGFGIFWNLPLILKEAGVIKNDSIKNKFSRFIQSYRDGEDELTMGEISKIISEHPLQYIFNVGIGYRHNYVRKISLTFYVFSNYIEEDYDKSYKVNSKNMLNEIFDKTCINRDFTDTLITINLKSDFFKEQKYEKFILNCVGACDSIAAKLELEHHIVTGHLDKSIEIAENVWESIRIRTQKPVKNINLK